MCGIVGTIGKQNAKDFLIKGLKNLEYRGYDSCGLALIENSKYSTFKSTNRIEHLGKLAKQEFANVGIAHTRWATHGIVNDINCHPHMDNSGKICIVHNGIIENYKELKTLLENSGYVLTSDTDSEVIPNLISFYYQNLLENGNVKNNCFSLYLDAISLCLKELKGSYALAIMNLEFPNKLIGARCDSPLVVAKGKSDMYLSSDVNAILDYTNTFYFLDDKEICVLDSKQKIDFYDINLKRLHKLENVINSNKSMKDENISSYMLKEIYEQPQALRTTINHYIDNPIIFDEDFLDRYNKIYLIGCGTAMHACLASKAAFEKLTNTLTIVDIASEFRYKYPMVDENTLCIFVSQSGETADTLACLKLCKEKSATCIAISNVEHSSITRLCNTYLTYAGSEIAVASTKAYTSQVALLNIVALSIAKCTKKISDKTFDKYMSDLKKIPTLVNNILNCIQINDIKKFAKKVISEQSIYFIGRQIDEISARESALKLKEISYIHADSYPSGELKHGAIALIEKGTTVVSIITDENIASKTISNVEEVISRGAKIFVITSLDLDNSNFDLIFKLPKTNEFLAPILSIIPGQIFAYYVASFKGYDIDKPRNLAKSVTVE